MRRTYYVVAVVVVLSMLAGCAGAPAAPAPVQATQAPAAQAPAAPAVQPTQAPAASGGQGPIKIGVLVPTTGNVAASGKDMLDGWNLYWDQHGKKAGGRDIEIYVEDSAGNPDTALTKSRLLVEQRQVHMLVGGLLANVGLAVADWAKGNGVPYFIPIVAADDLTQRAVIPNVLRVAGWTSSQDAHPAGDWAFKNGYKTAATIANDYAFGHENVGGFVHTYADAGGKVLGEIWNPQGTPDFSSYMAQLQSLNPQLVFTEQVGADSQRFVKAWSDFGLKGKIVLLGNETLTDQSLLRNMGPEAEGIMSVGHWAEGRNSPETQNFVNAYDKAYGKLPSYYSVNMYVAAMWIAAAIDKANGNVEDRQNLIKVVRETSFADTPLGPMKMDEYGNPVFNVYLRKVEKRPDGRLWNVVVETFPNVSQFWTWSPEEYMKMPAYTRDYKPPSQ